MYEACERLTRDRTDELLKTLSGVAEMPVHPHNDADYALGAAKRALERTRMIMMSWRGRVRRSNAMQKYVSFQGD